MSVKIKDNKGILCSKSRKFAKDVDSTLLLNKTKAQKGELQVLKGYLTCEIVAKLVPYYVDDKLDGFQRDCVAIHLRNCPNCMNKYTTIKKFLEDVRIKHKNESENRELLESISTHFDGECSGSELLNVEAAFCNDELANEKYEQIANLSKMMANSFMETKEKLVFDYSESVLEKYKKMSAWEKVIRFFGL